VVPGRDGEVIRKRPYQLHYAPARPYGEIITLSHPRTRRPTVSKAKSLCCVNEDRLPQLQLHFSAINLPVGNGVANYLL